MVFFDVFARNDDATEVSSTRSVGLTSKQKLDGGVNYDIKATMLYKLIEKQHWDAVVEHNNEYPDEAKVWVYRIDRNTNKTRWRMLPLHAAILFSATEEVIKGLIQSYPDAVTMGDDRRMLPLHLGFRNNSTEIIMNELLKVYPNAVYMKDAKGRVPVQLFTTKGGKQPQEINFLRLYFTAELKMHSSEKEKLNRSLEEKDRKITELEGDLQKEKERQVSAGARSTHGDEDDKMNNQMIEQRDEYSVNTEADNYRILSLQYEVEKQMVQSLTETIEENKTLLSQYEHERNEMNTKFAQYVEEKTRTEALLKDVSLKYEQQQNKANNVNEGIEKLSQKNEDLKQENKKLKTMVKELNSQVEESHKISERNMEQIQEMVSVVEKVRRAAKNKESQSKKTISNLEESLQSALSHSVELSQKVGHLSNAQETTANMEEQVETLKAELAEYKQKAGDLKQQVVLEKLSHEQKCEKMESELSATLQTAIKMAERVKQCQDREGEMTEQIHRLQEDLNQKNSHTEDEKADLEEKIQDLTEELLMTKIQLAGSKKRNLKKHEERDSNDDRRGIRVSSRCNRRGTPLGRFQNDEFGTKKDMKQQINLESTKNSKDLVKKLKQLELSISTRTPRQNQTFSRLRKTSNFTSHEAMFKKPVSIKAVNRPKMPESPKKVKGDLMKKLSALEEAYDAMRSDECSHRIENNPSLLEVCNTVEVKPSFCFSDTISSMSPRNF